MPSAFWRQFTALSSKNLVIAQRHWLLNLLRCLVLPIAYGIFLAFAPTFFTTPNETGIGSAIPIFFLKDHYNGKNPLVWVDNSGGTGYLNASDIMDHVMANFTEKQRSGVVQAKNTDDMLSKCLANFNDASPCFIAISFDNIPQASTTDTSSFNYTITADSGAYRIGVTKHDSDFETKVIPTQWAIDAAIIELTAGKQTPQILEMPYTHFTSDNTQDTSRLFFLGIISTFGGVTFLLALIGITYQLGGGLALERATLLTSHMQAMGALDSARILSWYSSMVALYLPTWIILGGLWKATLFVETSAGIVILTNILGGLGLASWSCIISVPFNKSPQLAAVVSTGVAIVLGVIPLMIDETSNTIAPPVLSFFFPSMFYVFMLKDISGFELSLLPANLSERDPTYNFAATPMIIAASVGIIFWPIFAVYLERWMYGVSNPSNAGWRKKAPSVTGISTSDNITITLRNVQKTFNPSMFRRKSRNVVAIADLTLDIPSYGIFVLLGANGAGKSTTLSILGGLTKPSSGSVTFSGNTSRPPRGAIGIVPQKNVLFSELSCLQTLRVWNAIKADGYQSEEELEQLIRDCDLQSKMHEPSGTLSGGQKRKLQLAIGLVGGSKIILVDECTSGVDPLSRRALWRTLTAYREERTIILTTHFLDEADFLADRIAVLAAPGKLIASDTPVALKSSMGGGYSIVVKIQDENSTQLLTAIQTVAPDTVMTFLDTDSFSYHLKTKDTSVTAAAVRLVENSKVAYGIASYDVAGTTIEDIFLDLVAQDEVGEPAPQGLEALESTPMPILPAKGSGLVLSNGQVRSPLAQALTIFHKRCLIARRSWLPPLLALAVGISGAWWPIRFVTGDVASCAHLPPQSDISFATYPPFLNNGTIPVSPPSLIGQINASLPELFVDPVLRFTSDGSSLHRGPFDPFFSVVDKESLIDLVNQNYHNFTLDAALFMDFDKNDFLIAYNVDPISMIYFSVASNMFFARALNESSSVTTGARKIVVTFQNFPSVTDQSLVSMQWLAIFGAAMVVYPAFFALYVSKERHSSVQAMQLSNGLSNPLGLWLGHLLFDSIFTVIIATVIAIVYGVVRHKFQGIGYLWFIICLYGFASTLYAYIIAIIMKSPLGGFALVVVSQFFIYLLYLTGYIVTFFIGNPQTIQQTFTVIHFTTALVAPIISLVRAAMVSVNQFSLACNGEHVASGTALGSITRLGGPILYLIMWILVLLAVLAQVDAGSIRLPWSKPKQNQVTEEKNGLPSEFVNEDVSTEVKQALSFSNADPLRVLNISKSFGKNKVVDDITFTIPSNSLFVMLGPNGAGKTTTLDLIRGSLKPDTGDVLVKGISTRTNVKEARLSFGVCPQFTAMDAHLTVKEHLYIYGRLRGLPHGELDANIVSVMRSTGLDVYSDRLATKLSGGNQRKLALAIALVGNPSVILVDEYSTGIDAKMKRELWEVLKQATKNKAVLLTTHSMEEASYLATKVGIISKRMLAIGTPAELESRHESYEVHFSCQTRDELVKVRKVMANIPGARMVDDVATRFEIPIHTPSDAPLEQGAVTSVASIFETLSKEGRDIPQFTVGKSSLETAFIRIINEDSTSRKL